MENRFIDDEVVNNDDDDLNDDFDDSPLDDKNSDEEIEEDYLFEEASKKTHEIREDVEKESNMTVFECPLCKTTFMNSNKDSKCLFCGNESNIVDKDSNMVNIFYLPFNKTLDEAKDDYKRKIRFNFFIPFAYRSKDHINNIKKVYVPALLRSVKANGNVVFYAADTEKKGKEEELRKYEVGYDVGFDFDNILLSLYSKLDSAKFSVLGEYDYSMLSLYNDGIISDCDCVMSDLEDNLVDEKISNNISRCCVGMVREQINHELKKIKQNDISMETVSEQKILIPVYLVNVNYNNKDNLYVMNAQSGNSSIEYELSIANIVIFSIVVFCLIFALVFLIAWIL